MTPTPPDAQPNPEASQLLPAEPALPEIAAGPKVATPARAKVRIKGRGKRPLPRRPAGPAAPQPPKAAMPTAAAEDDEKESFFQRFGKFIVIGGIVVAAGAWLAFKKPGSNTPAPRQERIVMIAPLPPLPPPPPPPPPPPQQKPPEEKMEKETAPAEESKPAPKPEPAKPPDAPAPLGTNLKGDGPSMSGLGTGGGLGGGTIGGRNGGGGSRFGWYAGQVQSKISDALRRNPKTREASTRIDVRIWADTTGRITRAVLAGSTGDTALDSAIRDGVLTGLQLQEPPPAGMKMPINLRLSAQRPR